MGLRARKPWRVQFVCVNQHACMRVCVCPFANVCLNRKRGFGACVLYIVQARVATCVCMGVYECECLSVCVCVCSSAGTCLNRKRGFGACILHFVLCVKTWIWGICVYVTLQAFTRTVNVNLEHQFYVVQIRQQRVRMGVYLCCILYVVLVVCARKCWRVQVVCVNQLACMPVCVCVPSQTSV